MWIRGILRDEYGVAVESCEYVTGGMEEPGREEKLKLDLPPRMIAEIEEVRRDMGHDWWPYGCEPNRLALETFLRYHHEQGLSKRRLAPEELFASETLEAFKI